MRECCGKCRHNKRDYSKSRSQGGVDFCCGNEDSDSFGLQTMYDDSCDEFDEKD